MTRRDLRNRHPFHQSYAAEAVRPAATYNRHSLRHKLRAAWARIRRTLEH